MKTKVKKTKRVIRKAKPVMTTALAIRQSPRMVLDLCGNCGKPDAKGGVWQDPETGTRHVWCRSKKCEAKVKAKLPRRIHLRYEKCPRPRIMLQESLYNCFNDIELSNDIMNGADVVRGYSAKTCHNAWAFSIFATDKMKALRLFKLKPNSTFLVFNEDGKMTAGYRTYKDAEKKRKKNEVIVWWGGR